VNLRMGRPPTVKSVMTVAAGLIRSRRHLVNTAVLPGPARDVMGPIDGNSSL
jgi:hypothetical protein